MDADVEFSIARGVELLYQTQDTFSLSKKMRIEKIRRKRGREVERRVKTRRKKMRSRTLVSSPAQNTLFPFVSKTELLLESETCRPLNPRGERLRMLACRSQEPP